MLRISEQLRAKLRLEARLSDLRSLSQRHNCETPLTRQQALYHKTINSLTDSTVLPQLVRTYINQSPNQQDPQFSQ